MSSTAIILAGGLGTRLRTRVTDLPKPMAPIGDRPFLAFLLDRLQQAGFRRAILSVGYRAESIESCFGTRYRDLELTYSREEEPLGTGGAIAQAISQCDEGRALVLNGDTYLELDYEAFALFHARSSGPLSMTVREVPDAGRFGAVTIEDGRVVAFIEKGSVGAGWINAGSYIVEADIFKRYPMPRKFSFELDFLMPHCDAIRPKAFHTDGYMIDIGIPEDFDRAQVELPTRVSS